MIIYNVTVNIEKDVHDDWFEWIKAVHIPDVMKTGMFLEYKMLKVLADEDSDEHTYSIQYTCESIEQYRRYETQYAPELRKDVQARYGTKFIAFRTLLEPVI